MGAGSVLTLTAEAALKTALYQDFYGLNEQSGNARIGLASTVYAARFYCPALAVEGVKNIQSIEIALSANAPADSDYADVVNINGDQEPVFATDNVTVVVPVGRRP